MNWSWVLTVFYLQSPRISLHNLPHKLKCSIYISDFIQTTFFYLGRFLKKLADDQCSSITKGSIYHINHYVHTTFYHSSGLTRNLMFNGSICYVLYLQILHFYLGRQQWKNWFPISAIAITWNISNFHFTSKSDEACFIASLK